MSVFSDFWSVVFALFISAGCLVMIAFPIPALFDDFGIRAAAQPLAGATIESGRCSTHIFLVDCDATLTLTRPGQPKLSRTEHYFFVDFHTGDYTARVVADPARPDVMSTDLALDKMGNRIATLAIAGPFFLAIVVFVIWNMLSTLRVHRSVRRALSGQPLRPLLLRLDGVGKRGWLVSHSLADGKVASQKWSVPRRARPIMMDPQRRSILGVTTGDGRIAMPLDAKLKWVKLSKEERKTLQAVLPV